VHTEQADSTNPLNNQVGENRKMEVFKGMDSLSLSPPHLFNFFNFSLLGALMIYTFEKMPFFCWFVVSSDLFCIQ
jgi:hypothetical protein